MKRIEDHSIPEWWRRMAPGRALGSLRGAAPPRVARRQEAEEEASAVESRRCSATKHTAHATGTGGCAATTQRTTAMKARWRKTRPSLPFRRRGAAPSRRRSAPRLVMQGSAERCFSACILPAVVVVVGLEPRSNGTQRLDGLSAAICCRRSSALHSPPQAAALFSGDALYSASPSAVGDEEADCISEGHCAAAV